MTCQANSTNQSASTTSQQLPDILSGTGLSTPAVAGIITVVVIAALVGGDDSSSTTTTTTGASSER